MAEANWYPDPDNPAQLRWFDGTQWTEHRAPAGGAAPAGAAPGGHAAGPSAWPPAGGGAVPIGSTGTSAAKGLNFPLAVLGAVAAALVVFGVGLVAGDSGPWDGFEKADAAAWGALEGLVLGVLVGAIAARGNRGAAAGLGALLGAVGGGAGGFAFVQLIETFEPDSVGIGLVAMVAVIGLLLGAGAGFGAGGVGGLVGGAAGGAVGWAVVASLSGALTEDLEQLAVVFTGLDFEFFDEWRIAVGLLVAFALTGVGIGIGGARQR